MPHADPEPLQHLFLQLAAIEGLSLAERRVADRVSAMLRAAGVRVLEDAAGARLGGDTGNLICLPPGFRAEEPALMLSAHLDTVQSTARLNASISQGRIYSDGTTILGADNRLGLAVLVHLLLTVSREHRTHANFMVVFTVAEELGMLGATQLDLSPYKVAAGFVFDCSRRPGVYIRDCAGAAVFRTTFVGKAAHAGVAPEQGINAISLASSALARVACGRIDADTTVNLGRIHGGVAVNVVPEEVVVEGEVRAFSAVRLQERLALIQDICHAAVDGAGTLRFESRNDFEPYVLPPDLPVVTLLERALHTAGLQPSPIRYMGGSDANVWNAKGVAAVNLGIGAQQPHSHEEFVLVEDLIKSAEIAAALVAAE